MTATSFEADLERARDAMARERAALCAQIAPITADALAEQRPGGWSAGHVLQHVIESEAIYVRLLAHLRGVMGPELDTSEPADGAQAVAMLHATRAAVLSVIDGIDEATLYRLERFGHEEYSSLSVLQNIAAHDIDHMGQLRELIAPSDTIVHRESPAGVAIRPATEADRRQIVEIYNHYVVHTPITFDLEPYTLDQRRPWFDQFADAGRHRLLVADEGGRIVGYAGSHQFRAKAAYDTTVETTVYCAPGVERRGIGAALYAALFGALSAEDVRMAIAGITLPNEASVALHERFGFRPAGVTHAVGRKFDRFWDVGWYEREMR